MAFRTIRVGTHVRLKRKGKTITGRVTAFAPRSPFCKVMVGIGDEVVALAGELEVLTHEEARADMGDSVLVTKVVAWRDLPNERFREEELKDTEIVVKDLEDIPDALKARAVAILKRRTKHSAVRVTVMFRHDNGVEGKLTYLAEREAK